MGDSAVKEKATEKEKGIRVLVALGGALAAVIVGVAVNVLSPRVDSFLDGDQVPSDDPICSDEARAPGAHKEMLDVLLRSVVDGEPDGCFTRSLDIVGETFTARIEYGNYTGETLQNVTLNAWVPEGVELVSGTTKILNANNPDGAVISDDILTSGVNIGGYTSGSNALIVFNVKVTAEYQWSCDIGILGVYARTTFPTDSRWVGAAAITEKEC